MPSGVATANLAQRVVRGGKRARITSAKTSKATKAAKPPAPKQQTAQTKQPAQPAQPATIAAKGEELAAVIDAAKAAPVTLTRKGKPAAIVFSARTYRKMCKLIDKLEEQEEDRACIAAWEKAMKEGFLTPEENDAFLREMRDAFGD